MMRNYCCAIFIALLVLSGCGSGDGDSRVLAWGSRGGIKGKFASPRAIDVYENFVYVADRVGRVQKFDLQGNYILEWRIEPYKVGTASSLSVDQNGDVWVPDTHNQRILHFNADGELLSSFGEKGEGPGQLGFPIAITFGKNGELYITEYSINDRVQVFSRDGEYLNISWGEHGDGEEQFNRPMGIALGPDGLLYVADAINHRIKVYTTEGKLVRNIGERGKGPGYLQFPYDIDIDKEGNLYIAEFGNHRIQKMNSEGASLGVWGSPGSAKGQLVDPWGAAVDGGMFYIADTKNHRIQAGPVSLIK